MASKVDLFNNLSLNKYYKYIIYVSGIILIGSLFLETKVIEQTLVQTLALKTCILGIFLWVLREIYLTIISFFDMELEYNQHSYDSQKENVQVVTFFYHFLEVFILIFGLINIF